MVRLHNCGSALAFCLSCPYLTVTLMNLSSAISKTAAIILIASAAWTIGCGGVLDSVNQLMKSAPDGTPPPALSSINVSGLQSVKKHSRPVTALAVVGSDNRQIISADTGGTVLVWDLKSGKAYDYLHLQGPIDNVALFPAKDILASSGPGKVAIYRISDRKKLYETQRVKARSTSLKFQFDGEAVLIGGADGRVYRWKYLQEATGKTEDLREKALERYIAHSSVIGAIATHPFGRVFFSGDWLGNMYAWLPFDSDAYKGEYDLNLFGGRFFSSEINFAKAGRAQTPIVAMECTNDGQRLFVATQTGDVEVWQIRGYKVVAHAHVQDGLVTAMAINYDGTKFVIAGRDGIIRVFDVTVDDKFDTGKQDATPFKIVPSSIYKLPDVQAAIFKGNKNLLVGTAQGNVVEAAIDNSSAKPTPLPTPQNIPEIADNDYK